LRGRTAPSYNLQHWRFVAVTKPEDKQRLVQIANGQIKVAEAAVTLIVLGDLQAIDRSRNFNRE